MDTMTPPRKSVGFQEAINLAFKNYCVFTGRAGIAEFWWFCLFTFILGFACGLLGKITGLQNLFTIISYILGLICLLPILGLAWRRLHDTGRAGGWFFIGLIPIIGAIILIWWLVQPSEQGPNRFGDPA